MALLCLYFILGLAALGAVLFPFLKAGSREVNDRNAPEAGQNDVDIGAKQQGRRFRVSRLSAFSMAAGASVIIAAALLFTSSENKPASSNAQTEGAQNSSPNLPDVDTMISGLERRLESHPDDPEGWRMLGWSYFATQNYDRSAKAYARAVAMKPENAVFQSAYGEALTKAAGDKVTPAAQEAFRKALSKDGHDLRAKIYLGLLRHQKGDSKTALQDLRAALGEAAPNSTDSMIAKDIIRKVSTESGISVADWLGPKAATEGPDEHPQAAGESPPGPTKAEVQAAQQLSPKEQQAMIEGMVNKLDARLTASPKDLDGWIMLIRSRKQLGEDDKARLAVSRGKAAFSNDASAQARLDDAAHTFGVQ